MKRYADTIDVDGFTVLGGADPGVRFETLLKDGRSGGGGEIRTASPSNVVAVRVSHHGSVHCGPRVHVEVSGLAVQASVGGAEETHWLRPSARRTSHRVIGRMSPEPSRRPRCD